MTERQKVGGWGGGGHTYRTLKGDCRADERGCGLQQLEVPIRTRRKVSREV